MGVYGGAQAKGRDREEKERRKGGGREEEDIGDLRGRGVRRETKGTKGGGVKGPRFKPFS